MRPRPHSLMLSWVPVTVTLLAPFVMVRRLTDGNALPKATLIVAGAVLCLMVWSAEMLTRKVTVPWGRVAAAAAMLWLALFAAAVNAPVAWYAYVGQPNRANGLWLYSAATVFFLVVAARWSPGDVRRWEQAMVAVTGGLLAHGTWQWLGGGVDGAPPAIVATLGNPNFLSGSFGIAVPLLAGLALRAGRSAALGLASMVLWCMALIAMSDSVQGLFAGAAGLVVVLIIRLWAAGGTPRRLGVPVAAALSAVAGVLGVAGLASAGPLARVMQTGTLTTRQWYWDAAARMVADRPALGVGLGQYADFYRRFRPAGATGALTVANTADNAHSVPLHLAAEGGVVLLAAYLAFAALVGWRLIRGVAARSGRDAVALAGIGGAWLAYHVQAAVSIDMPLLILLHFMLAGCIVALTGNSARSVAVGPARGARPSWVVPAVAVSVVALLAGIWFTTAPLRASRATVYGRVLVENKRVPEGMAYFAKALDATPGSPLVLADMANALGSLRMWEPAYERMLDAIDIAPHDFPYTLTAARLALQAERVDQAAELYARVIELDPTSPEALEEVARFQLRHGDPAEAEELARRAVRHDRERGDSWLVLGEVLQGRGRIDEAREAFAQAARLLDDPERVEAAQERTDTPAQ